MKARILVSLAIAAVAAIAFSSLDAAPPDRGFVAHEWGTFTSVQGANGLQMDWNPLVAPELPAFVYDRVRHPGGAKIPGIRVAGKTAITCTQRLETPVIYFYSDRTRTVDVSVGFPQGSVTEWYPLESANDVGLLPKSANLPGDIKPALHWGKVQMLVEPDTKGVMFPEEKLGKHYGEVGSGSHYYAARETGANMLQVVDGKNGMEAEKFLFYRGVGSFEAPLTVKLESSDSHRVSLTNTGPEDLRNLFLYEVTSAGGAWVRVDRLALGQTRTVALPAEAADSASSGNLANLAAELRKTLVSEGLYEPEAAAMVKTWETSWFAEKGMRVLYTLPRQWTDRTLPLQITPAPKKTERVMVGRAEIITPEMEHAMLAEADKYVAATPEARPAIVKETQALGLGRFMEPTLRRVSASVKRSNDFYSLSWELLQSATFAPKAAGK